MNYPVMLYKLMMKFYLLENTTLRKKQRDTLKKAARLANDCNLSTIAARRGNTTAAL